MNHALITKAWRATVGDRCKTKIVLVAIASSATSNDSAAYTHATLSQITNLTLGDVEDAVTWLQNEGYIVTTHRGPGDFAQAVFTAQLLTGDWR